MPNILGIDLGTTSVKVVVYDIGAAKVIHEYNCPTEAYICNNDVQSEQNVAKIVSTVEKCIEDGIPEDIQKKTIGIGICGQMHGVTCWSSDKKPWSVSNAGNTFQIEEGKVTPLYTWQDGRCDAEFLKSLPEPDSHLTVHTGYGCCTLFHLTKNDLSALEEYNCAGTVADFVVSMICELDRPIMCTQNAASWGYFNTETNEWNVDMLRKHNFPVHLLPTVVQPRTIAGCLKRDWHRIPAGTPVGVAIGDLHGYVYATLEGDDHAVVNISTSAQLVHIEKGFHPKNVVNDGSKVVPYFDGKYIYEAALLNGGNALDLFVSSFHEFFKGINLEIDTETLWNGLIRNATEVESDLVPVVVPAFLGERYDPQRRASISNMTAENFKLPDIFRGFCKGIIAAFQDIVTVEKLKRKGITKITGSGSGLLKNKILQLELERQYYPLPVEYKRCGDSPLGAALCVLQSIQSEETKK